MSLRIRVKKRNESLPKSEPIFFSSRKNPKGKILILANEFYPQICIGGLGRFVAGISQALVKRNWGVAVFAPVPNGPIYFPFWSLETQKRSKKLAKEALVWCQRNFWMPDFCWVQDIEGVYQAEVWKNKAKILWTIHNPIANGKPENYGYGYSEQEGNWEPINWGDDFFDFSSLIERGIAACDVITTVSPSFARNLEQSFLFTRMEEILGISNGIDKNEWNPQTDLLLGFKLKNSWREFKAINKKILQTRFGLPTKNVPLFVFVSRLVPQKGLDLLIQVLPKFLAQNQVQLVVVGQGLKRDNQFFENLRKYFFLKLGLCLKSDFSLPHQIFAGADFLLLPSVSEPYGIVVAEARSYGTIPLVRRIDGLADQVRDKIDGLSFERNSVDSLLEKLHQALKCWQTDWWWEASLSGKNLVEDWDRVAKKYEERLLCLRHT